MQGIKNIIFDLGGVLLDVNYQLTEAAFSQIGIEDYKSYFKQDYSAELFENLEKGTITPSSFYDEFRTLFGTTHSNEDIRHAWNAMLGNFIPDNMQILKNSTKNYKVYLFSNTNQIHYECFRDIYLKQFGNNDFDSHFIKAYYSQICGWRKPTPQSYTNLLEAEGLTASETLFIDDTEKNIIGANEAGLKTFHLKHPTLLSSLNI